MSSTETSPSDSELPIGNHTTKLVLGLIAVDLPPFTMKPMPFYGLRVLAIHLLSKLLGLKIKIDGITYGSSRNVLPAEHVNMDSD